MNIYDKGDRFSLKSDGITLPEYIEIFNILPLLTNKKDEDIHYIAIRRIDERMDKSFSLVSYTIVNNEIINTMYKPIEEGF